MPKRVGSIFQEALYREIKSGYPKELVYAYDLVLVNEPLKGLKARLEIWTKVMASNTLRMNVKETSMIIYSEKV